jgi:hypothetical protein
MTRVEPVLPGTRVAATITPMPADRIVLDHLLEGREALQREVLQLTAAIEQLDAVLGLLGSSTATPADGSVAAPVPTRELVAAPAAAEPVNPPVEVEASGTVRARSRVTRKPPTKRSSRPRAVGSGEPPKSIRVHVLEMLEAENREFGLAEIIDRVHDAGIQAHDDAVRSITIKLMKDGRVERVGRGQYRLARRGSAGRASAISTAAPSVFESAPEPDPLPVAAEPIAAELIEGPPADGTGIDDIVDSAAESGAAVSGAAVLESETVEQNAFESEPAGWSEPTGAVPTGSVPTGSVPTGSAPTGSAPAATEADAVETVATRSDDAASDDEATAPPYAPSLNLGQPWNS